MVDNDAMFHICCRLDLLKHNTNVGCWVNIDSTLRYWHWSNVGMLTNTALILDWWAKWHWVNLVLQRRANKLMTLCQPMIAIWDYTFSRIDYVFFNLYLFKVSSKSTISLLFVVLSNIDLIFTFLSIDSQPCRNPNSSFNLGRREIWEKESWANRV